MAIKVLLSGTVVVCKEALGDRYVEPSFSRVTRWPTSLHSILKRHI